MDDFDRLRGSDDGQDLLEEPLSSYEPRSRAPLIGLAVLLVAVAIGLWWWSTRTPPAQPAAKAAARSTALPPATTPATDHGLGIGEPDANLPGLGELDGYVRPILAALSSRPELAALLATDDLVRRFVVSVEAVARGASPAAQVRAVAPRGAFRLSGPPGATVIDPASYDRYDGLVRMVEDMEPEDLARLYGRLKPRLEDAHAELGVAGTAGTLDEVMARAIRHLLDTPELPQSARIQPARGVNYAYVDPAIEGLSSAQKQLLRLGPDRAARVKEHLRRFGQALGIPPDRLTSAR
jgi:hypothetical protein